MLIAPAAATAFDHGPILTVGHIVHHGAAFLIANHGAPGNADNQSLAALARAAFALTVSTVGSHIFPLVTEIHQGRHIVVHAENHVAALAAVTTVRAAGCNIFFTVECHRSVAALAGSHGNGYFIYKR